MASRDQSFPWDVKFSISGGNTYGFMLTSPPDATKQLALTEAPGPNPDRLVNSNDYSVQDFNPLADVPFSMTDWSGGVGQLYYDDGIKNKYLWGEGLVTHVPGKMYIAPTPTVETVTVDSTQKTEGFYTWISPTGVRWDWFWTNGGDSDASSLFRRNATSITNTWSEFVSVLPTDKIRDFAIIDNVGLLCIDSSSGGTSDIASFTGLDAGSPTFSPGSPPSDFTAFSVGTRPRYIRQVRGTTYAMVNPNKIFYTSSIAADSWVGPIDIGTGGNITGPAGGKTYNFKGSNAVNNFLFARKDDAIYSVNAQQQVEEVVWQWKDRPSDLNFKYACNYVDRLAFSVGNEVFTYDPISGTTESLQLAMQESFSVSEIKGVSANNQYIFVLAKVKVLYYVTQQTRYAVFRCYETQNGWAYEVIWASGDTDLGAYVPDNIYASPNGADTLLYWHSSDSVGHIKSYKVLLPATWDESKTVFTSTTNQGLFYSSISKSGFPSFTKRHLYYNVQFQNVQNDSNGNNRINNLYNIAPESSQTFTSMLVSTTSSETETSYSNLSSSAIAIQLALLADSAGPSGTQTSPVVSGFDHHQRVRYKFLPTIKLGIRLADNIMLRNKQKSNKRIWELWEDLQALRTSAAKITYEDFLGNTFDVSIDLIGIKPTRHQGVVDYEEEAVITITRSDRGS